MCLLLIIFFFQAEDGIRDLVRSRGLGDVYKRQDLGNEALRVVHELGCAVGLQRVADVDEVVRSAGPVSYTHLTLPTSDLV